MKWTILLTLLGFSLTIDAQLVDSLPDEAWNESEWICVADAPEVQGRVDEDTRAADGANWFVTTLTNEKSSAKFRFTFTHV